MSGLIDDVFDHWFEMRPQQANELVQPIAVIRGFVTSIHQFNFLSALVIQTVESAIFVFRTRKPGLPSTVVMKKTYFFERDEYIGSVINTNNPHKMDVSPSLIDTKDRDRSGTRGRANIKRGTTAELS